MGAISILAGPVIGSLIGYVTNFIAVKMLFRPLRPVKIGKFRLPFTPGIFPKRKDSLAKALGNAVGNNLLTGEDLEQFFLTLEVKEKILQKITTFYSSEDPLTFKKLATAYIQEEDYLRGRAKVEALLTQKIYFGILELDLGDIIIRESKRAIKEKTEGTMLAFMVNDKLITSLTTPIGNKIETYIKENGLAIIRSLVSAELGKLEDQAIPQFLNEVGLEEQRVLEIADRIYSEFIRTKVAEFIKQFDIPGVVEGKVKAMDVLEIEQLVLSVMRKELKAVVNLGALIGLIIGTINIFI
ncbi:MAG: DUF445 domain-containing protein [Desulfitobacteriia bacterium]